MQGKQKNKSPFLTIFLTVFLDMLGVGIIIPVIPVLFFGSDSSFFPDSISTDARSVLFGFLLASYPIMQLFGAPALGSLSDRHGRKPILILSLVGTLIGYLLFGTAILIKSLPLLFFSRMIPGFTGGNIAIIFSAISDLSSEDKKAQNFGLVGMAFGLGFILGPAIGGLLADDQIVSWFNPATPFWFTSILTLLNIGLVRWVFSETLKEPRKSRISFFEGIQNITRSFSISSLRIIFTIVLLLSLGFSFFTQFFSVLLIDKFDYTEARIGIIYAWIGIWIAFTQGALMRIISRRFRPQRIVQFTILILSFTIAIALIPDKSIWLFVITPFIAISQGLTSPNMLSLVSAQASDDRQGEILGLNQSMSSLGHALPPIIAGYINTINGNLPLIAAASLILIAWMVFMIFFKK